MNSTFNSPVEGAYEVV